MNGDGGDETWLSTWEEQCVTAIDEQPNYEQLLITDGDSVRRRLWTAFQECATSVAQLYSERYAREPGALWLPFQAAAGTVTALYKESCEGVKKTNELGVQCGYQKRNRELLNWAKKKRRNIRREDLLAYLSGRPAPPKPNTHHHHHHHPHFNHHRVSPRPRNISPPPNVAGQPALGADVDLNTFREALSRRPRGSELCAFITGEIARHCKRPASPLDVTMGSPSHQKKPRYM